MVRARLDICEMQDLVFEKLVRQTRVRDILPCPNYLLSECSSIAYEKPSCIAFFRHFTLNSSVHLQTENAAFEYALVGVTSARCFLTSTR